MRVATWQHHCTAATGSSLIMPDGCRDLIYACPPIGAPRWFISPLHDRPTAARLEVGTRLVGHRLHPGVRIEDAELLASLHRRAPDAVDIDDRLHTLVHIDPFVDDALEALNGPGTDVARAAGQVGVSTRTLHRRLVAATKRTPVYWMMLARARRTARALLGRDDLAAVAAEQGYADQAHMSRALRRWFGVTPKSLTAPHDLVPVLHACGYG